MTLRCARRRALAQPAEHLLAAEPGQVHVEQDEVVTVGAREGDGVRPVAHLVALKPFGPQYHLAQPADVLLVVHDQHPAVQRVGRPVRGGGVGRARGRRDHDGRRVRRGVRQEREQRPHRGLGGGVPLRRVGGHHPAEHRVQPRGHLGAKGAGAGRRAEGGHHVGERGLPGERVEERAAEAEHVGPRVHRVRVAGLLRGHVPDRAELRAGAGDLVLARQPGQPEVEQLRLPVRGDEDVRRLDVAVDEVEPVRLDERVGDLVRDLAGERDRQRRDGRDPLQVGAGDVLHHEVRHGRGVGPARRLLPGVDRGDDVRVLQPADGAHLQEEPREGARVGLGRRAQRLHRDHGPQLAVFGPVHDAHSAVAEVVEQPVVAEDQAVQPPVAQARRLELGEQFGEDQGVEKGGVVRGAIHRAAVVGGQGVVVLDRDDTARDQTAQQWRELGFRHGLIRGSGRAREGGGKNHGDAPCEPACGPSRGEIHSRARDHHRPRADRCSLGRRVPGSVIARS